MMKNIAKNVPLLVLLVIIGLAPHLGATGNSAAFTRITLHPQAVGLGGSYVTQAEGAVALKWNPASVGISEKQEVVLAGTQQYETTTLRLDTLFQTKKWPIAISYLRSDFGRVYNTQANTDNSRLETTGETSQYIGQSLYAATSFRLLPKFYIGASAGYIHEAINSDYADGWGMDIGLLYKSDSWRWGATLSNAIEPKLAWSTGSQESAKVPHYLQTGLAKQWLGGRVRTAADLRLRENRESSLHMGVEVFPVSRVSCRVGSDNGQLTLGTGLHLESLEAHVSWRQKVFAAVDEAFQFGLKYEWDRRK